MNDFLQVFNKASALLDIPLNIFGFDITIKSISVLALAVSVGISLIYRLFD